MLTVTEHGVVPDGTTLNTNAIQKLIDKCGKTGGGTLLFPTGRYLTGGLELRSNLTLHLESGATLLGSTNLGDYTLYNPSPVRFFEDKEGLRALLFAHRVNNIRLSGQGTIDGQGPLINRPKDVRASMPPQYLVWRMRGCHCRRFASAPRRLLDAALYEVYAVAPARIGRI